MAGLAGKCTQTDIKTTISQHPAQLLERIWSGGMVFSLQKTPPTAEHHHKIVDELILSETLYPIFNSKPVKNTSPIINYCSESLRTIQHKTIQKITFNSFNSKLLISTPNFLEFHTKIL
ncbi:hypothetical protein LSTR_LSTR014822 [Laodelphax striatellus]|uniref:Uncharacterized protein n=1 Tax=Laodelphax striatellus TaxID=195883 RepID=A0A482X870_LAOST|nr:hypothetical protein LSTR_LSTR014822 [Laodelphax striatellus]